MPKKQLSLEPDWVSGVGPAVIWTALYVRGTLNRRGHCWNVEFGHSQGQPITKETAVRLAQNYLKKHRRGKLRGYSIRCLLVGTRRYNGL